MSHSRNLLLTVVFAATFALLTTPGRAAQAAALWQIGKPDNGNTEFALAPSGYNQFKNDGFFVVGESDAKRD